MLPASASADRQYGLRYGAVERGDIAMASNTIVTCPDGAPNCATAQAGTGPVVRNSAWVMVPIDIDSDPSTFDSSSSDLRLPPGATILYAGLYWGSDTMRMPEGVDAPNPSARGTVKLAAPDGAGYRTITASTVDDDVYYRSRYQGFADVTSLVRSAGTGTYTVANVQASTGKDQYGGWGLIVAYRDPSKPVRWLGLYDGFRSFSGQDDEDVPIGGFKTPASGTVRADFGMLTYEGDIGVAPDTARLNGVDVVDALHDRDNYWNARITEYGQHVTTKNPNYVNQLGMETSIVRADGSLPNNAQSALVHMEVSTDLVMPGAMTLVSDQAASAPAASAAPAITGTARDGQTLTAGKGTWSGTTPMNFAYQWLRCNSSGSACEDIEDATASTHAVGADDVGSTIRVRVTASNVVGPAGSTSSQTAVVTVRPPVNTAAPSISGTARDGQTLTALDGTWTGTSIDYSYRWFHCNSGGAACAPIADATAATFALTPSEVGRTIRVEVTGSNSGGNAVVTSGQTAVVVARAPASTAPPLVSGTARDGHALTATDGSWIGTPTIDLDREWQRCDSSGNACVAMSAAAGYTLAPGDVGHTIRVRVTGTNGAGSSGALSDPTAVVQAAAPANTLLPAITGTARDGQTLTVSNGTWTGTPTVELTRRWLRCDGACTEIPNATGTSYTLTPADVGNTIRVEVTGANGGGATPVTTPPTAVVAATPPANTAGPAISGTARDGQTLTVSAGTWTGTPTVELTRRWLRCDGACTEIPDATGTSYTLTPADVGATIRVEVTGTNGGGDSSVTSGPTGTVAAAPPANTAAPAISGTARDGQTLTASAGDWSGTPAIDFTRQWQRCDSSGGDCVPIASATGASYSLTPGDVGATIRVVVTGGNDGGTTPATSGPTPVVAPAPPASTAAPSVSGTARDGLTLGSTEGSWTGTPTVELTRQWRRCDSTGENCEDIDAATGPAYLLTPADVGRTIRVRVTAANAGGNLSVSSASTLVVAAEAPANGSPPTISGIARDAAILSAQPGGWTGTAPLEYTHQWLRCDSAGATCAPIPGATAAAYELTPGDVDHTIRVAVTGANGGGAASATSGQTGPIEAGPPVNAAPPTVTGTARDGELLTAGEGSWTGTPTIAYTRRWRRCDPGGTDCANIPGATGSTYLLGADDVGRAIQVRVTAANAGGQRSVDSEHTATVAAIPPSGAERPQLSGSAREGEALAMTDGAWSGSAPLIRLYRWERCDSAGLGCTAIAGANEATYTLTAADAGSRMRGVVTATNAGGSASAASDPTAVVAPKPAPPDPPPIDPPPIDPPPIDPPPTDPPPIDPPGTDLADRPARDRPAAEGAATRRGHPRRGHPRREPVEVDHRHRPAAAPEQRRGGQPDHLLDPQRDAAEARRRRSRRGTDHRVPRRGRAPHVEAAALALQRRAPLRQADADGRARQGRNQGDRPAGRGPPGEAHRLHARCHQPKGAREQGTRRGAGGEHPPECRRAGACDMHGRHEPVDRVRSPADVRPVALRGVLRLASHRRLPPTDGLPGDEQVGRPRRGRAVAAGAREPRPDLHGRVRARPARPGPPHEPPARARGGRPDHPPAHGDRRRPPAQGLHEEGQAHRRR